MRTPSTPSNNKQYSRDTGISQLSNVQVGLKPAILKWLNAQVNKEVKLSHV
jgi:hypothetical protein